MIKLILFFGALAFFAYAMYAHYHATDSTQSVPARVGAALAAAGAALGAFVMEWLKSVGTP